jgi:hypothetical protein
MIVGVSEKALGNTTIYIPGFGQLFTECEIGRYKHVSGCQGMVAISNDG